MISNGWIEKTLGNFVSLQRGHDLPEQNRRFGKVPILGSFGVTGYHDEAISSGPGVTVGRSGASFGVVSYSPVDYWPLNTALYVTDFHGNDARFVYYFLKTIDFKPYNSGSAQPSLNRNFISSIRIRVPSLTEQVAIATILGSLDDKIECNRRMNRTLEAIARALFRSWFVDFDPVRAKADGRTLAGMDAETAALFPDHFKDSELGKIPAGWKVGSLLEQAELLSGGTPSTSHPAYWGGDIPWASAKDVSQCQEPFLIRPGRNITRLGLEESSTKVIPAWSTVVVARGATTGRLCLFGADLAMNQTCYALRSRIGADSALYCQLREDIDQLVHAAHGSVFDTITTRTFQASRLLLADSRLLRAFESKVRVFFEQILNLERELQTLAALRDTLLPKLISGEVRVPDAERRVAKVV